MLIGKTMFGEDTQPYFPPFFVSVIINIAELTFCSGKFSFSVPQMVFVADNSVFGF